MPENFDLINKLFEKYEQMMFDIALNILQNRYDAEDVVQDAFSWLINNPKAISDISDDEKRFYLTSMVKHISLNYIKKKKAIRLKILTNMRDWIQIIRLKKQHWKI